MTARSAHIIDFNDGHAGPSNNDRLLMGPWQRTGDHVTPGAGYDDDLTWNVDRSLIGPDATAVMVRVKAKVHTSASTTGQANEGEYAILWVGSGTPAGETLNHFLHLETYVSRITPQTGTRNIKYANVILPIENEQVTLSMGSSQAGADTLCEVQGYVEYGISFAEPATPGVYFDGTTGNYVSTPDHADLDITDNLGITLVAALDDWTPSPTNYLVAKRASSQFSFQLSIASNGRPTLTVSPNGGTGTLGTAECTAPVGVADGRMTALRCTFAAGTVKFYTSPPDASPFVWTQLGSDVTMTNSITSIHAGTAGLDIGAILTGSTTSLVSKGRFRRCIIDNNGTVVADWRPVVGNKITTDRLGRQWTVNGSTWDWG